jgi:hypothetical protein
MKWISADHSPEDVPPTASSPLRPVLHWVFPLCPVGSVHLRQLPGLRDGYGCYGPWQATYERPDGAVFVLAKDIRIVLVQRCADDVIRADAWGEWATEYDPPQCLKAVNA